MQQITKLKCDNCESGIVKLIVKEKGNKIEVLVKDCDSCKKSFGIKSVKRLEKLT